MTYESIAFRIEDGVARVTLNAPDRGNPIDGRFAAEFCAIANECTVDSSVRAVLIDGTGRFFSVGGDLNELAKSRDALPRFVQTATADLHMGISRFARMNAPVVMAVHGLAAGGMVAIAAGADFVLASASAKFYAAFAAIGIISDSGGSYFLPRRMGIRRAAEFLMLNQTLTAEEAREAGLVSRVVPPEDLATDAMALARQLAAGPTIAFGELKNLLLDSPRESLEGQLEREARAMARVAKTDDAWNAMQAVKAKQAPVFDGR